MDRLIEAIEKAGNPSVVGLDPKPTLLPEPLLAPVRKQPAQDQPSALADAYWRFNKAIIDAVTGIVPAVKPQIAMYEALGVPGIDAYVRTAAYAQKSGLYVLGDVKRGDIGSTAAAYASHLSGMSSLGDELQEGERGGSTESSQSSDEHPDLWHEDAVTVNPYLGTDGIAPFVTAANNCDKDLFVLVRTSNPSSSELQCLRVEQSADPTTAGAAHAGVEPTVADTVGSLVESWAAPTRGHYGYSRVGAVVGATHPLEGKKLRSSMPHTFFLIPGFGAQGGSAADVAAMFDSDGRGAIVNSSRGIIGAWRNQPESARIAQRSQNEALERVADSARTAALTMKKSIVTELEKISDR